MHIYNSVEMLSNGLHCILYVIEQKLTNFPPRLNFCYYKPFYSYFYYINYKNTWKSAGITNLNLQKTKQFWT